MTKIHDRLGWLCVVLIALSPVPFGSNPPIFWAVSGMAVGLLGIYYVLSLRMNGITLPLPPGKMPWISLAFVLFCTCLVIQMLPLGAVFGPFVFLNTDGGAIQSNSLSIAPGSTWMMLIRWLSYGLFFLLMVQVCVSQQRANRILIAIFWVVVAHAVFGLVELTQLGDTVLWVEKTDYIGSATGTFINRNSYATFLAMGLGIGATIIMRMAGLSGSDRQRFRDNGGFGTMLLVSAGMGAIIITLLLSQSKMGFFAGAVGGCFAVVFGLRLLSTNRGVVAGLGVLVMFGVAALVLVYGESLFLRVIKIGASSDDRGLLYEQVLHMIGTRPWIGFGGGSFELAFPMFHLPPLPVDVVYGKAHSTYLALWSEMGVVAGSLPLLIIALIVGRLVYRYFGSSAPSATMLAGIVVVIVCAIHSTVDFSLEIQGNTYLFVGILALATASSRNVSSRHDAVPADALVA